MRGCGCGYGYSYSYQSRLMLPSTSENHFSTMRKLLFGKWPQRNCHADNCKVEVWKIWSRGVGTKDNFVLTLISLIKGLT